MHITKISIQNFRSFGPEPQTLLTQPGVNVVVGENNSGKSSLFAAVEIALKLQRVPPADFPFGDLTQAPSVCVESAFSPSERARFVYRHFGKALQEIRLISGEDLNGLVPPLGESLFGAASHLVGSGDPVANLGPGKVIGPALIYPGATKMASDLKSVLRSMNKQGIRAALEQERINIHVEASPADTIREFATDAFRKFSDIRPRPEGKGVDEGAEILESFDGTSTANYLFNLYAGDAERRAKYERIEALFSEFFPGLTFAVSVHGNRPHIVFGRVGKRYDIPQARLGTGVLEVLTILANVEGKSEGVLVLEEPGCHLHPHAQRALQRLILELSKANQVFVVTHSPEFVNWADFKALFRVAVKDSVSKVFSVPPDLTGNDEAALVQALRDRRKHDLLFARAVGLVEGETERAFLEVVSPRIGKDPDLASVSLLDVGGEGQYVPFIRFLQALSIPVRCLRDKAPNGISPKYKELFRTPGAEFEDFMRAQGHGALLDEAIAATGKSKPRAGRYMAEKIALDKVPQIYLDFLADLETVAKT